MGKLATLNAVKARIGIEAYDPKDDGLLNGLLTLVSGRFEEECNRKFDRAVNGVFEFAADAWNVLVDRYPVEAVSAWHWKADETEGWVVKSDVRFTLGRACVLRMTLPLGGAGERGRVTYTGGYVLPGTAPGAGQTALPGDIEQAAIEQTAHWYREKNRIGLASVSGDGGSVQGQPMSVVKPLDLLPLVQSILQRHERIVL